MHLRSRTVRCTRRAGLTGSMRRVADPFRRGFEKEFDGTVTGQISQLTAVDGRPTATGSDNI
jgi:hypothetical protein